MSNDLIGPVLEPESGNVKRMVVMLHGVGSNGDDLACLAPILSKTMPDTLFFTPNGIEKYDQAPEDFEGYQWFSLESRSPHALLQGVSQAASIVNPALDGLLEHYKLSSENMALFGFSQGTMTSLYCATHRAEKIAGVVGFSGALIGADVHPHAYTAKPPVCLIHGEEDMVVPFAAMAHAQSVLSKAGIEVETHARPMLAHTIDMEGIEIAQHFLKRIFKMEKETAGEAA
jgi:phospholipase/carboxylesterase